MHCSRCLSDAGMDTSAALSSPGLASDVAVETLTCPECGGPMVCATILAQLDRFGLAGRSAPLLELRREDA